MKKKICVWVGEYTCAGMSGWRKEPDSIFCLRESAEEKRCKWTMAQPGYKFRVTKYEATR
jgi:hypothetical protein